MVLWVHFSPSSLPPSLPQKIFLSVFVFVCKTLRLQTWFFFVLLRLFVSYFCHNLLVVNLELPWRALTSVICLMTFDPAFPYFLPFFLFYFLLLFLLLLATLTSQPVNHLLWTICFASASLLDSEVRWPELFSLSLSLSLSPSLPFTTLSLSLHLFLRPNSIFAAL